MGIKMVFDSEANLNCRGKDPETVGAYLKSKEAYWNQFKDVCGEQIKLSLVLMDLEYDPAELAKDIPEVASAYWEPTPEPIDFGMTFDENGHFLLNFNCKVPEVAATPAPEEKKRCYFWKVYKYSVDISEITLRGWVDWCNELYKIQHGKPRPKNNRIFINPDMKVAMVKGRSWNKNKIEKWLTDHGYSWTCAVETKYQWQVKEGEDVELVDSDAELMARGNNK